MNSPIPPLNLEPYRGHWVALDPESHQVLGHDELIDVAEQQAIQQSMKHPLLYPVPESDGFFVGMA